MVVATAALAQGSIGAFETTGPQPVSSGTMPPKGLRLAEGEAMPSASGTRTGEIDPDVVAAAVGGDDEAFIAVMRHYDRRLRIVAYHVLGDRQLMDDVLQDVTLRAYGALPRFAATPPWAPGCAASRTESVATRSAATIASIHYRRPT